MAIPSMSLSNRDLGQFVPNYNRKPRNFKGSNGAERAYRFAKWALAGPMQNEEARKWCRDHNIPVIRAMQESVNEKGGHLVAPEFGNDLIDLREEYGAFRRNARIVPMISDSRSDLRREGGLTAYFESEGDAGTLSDKAWSRVGLSAKKLMVLARYSSELAEDSLVNFGDDMAGEIAYAFALKEDLCGFTGDGTLPFGGITGVLTKLKGLSGTIANIAGLVVATGTGYATSYNSIVLKDFNKVKGKLPAYALRRNPKWFFSQSFWSEVVEGLVMAAGGITSLQIAAGMPPSLLGYPVEIAQVLPTVSATSQVCALFGCLDLSASMGTRRDLTIAMSEHSRFANDEIEIRGTERMDINVHDVGNADATAANRVPGPIVGLITAAS